MEKAKKRIEYRKLTDSEFEPWLTLTNIDELIWNGVFVIRISGDDGTSGLPFRLGDEEMATFVVKDHANEGKLQNSRTIVHTVTRVERSTGKVFNYTRTRCLVNGIHQWTNWEAPSVSGSASAGETVEITLDENFLVDTITNRGTYHIRGERVNANDGLPVLNAAPGHSMDARLVVLDSSIDGEGNADDKCMTQILMLSNRTAGDGDVYIRTGRGAAYNGIVWEAWGKLQQNVEVGTVTSLDRFIDNGMYSGVYTDGTFFETFVMVVINNYAVAGALGKTRSINQFKYALNVDGTSGYKSRTGTGTGNITWGEWEIINKDGVAAMVATEAERAKAAEAAAIEKGKQLVLRSLFVAAGAEYNDTGTDKTKTAPWGETVTHKAGHYYLNGLGDITEEQMMEIYNKKDVIYRLNFQRILQYENVRTIISVQNLAIIQQILKDAPLSTVSTFYECKSLEILMWGNGQSGLSETREQYIMPVSSGTANIFCNCKKLRIVFPLNCNSITNFVNCFANCNSLVEVRLYKVKASFSLAESSYISKESVLYVIQNALPTSAITITLHPDAYARLADDVDIVAALEAQPLVSLVSA